MAVLRPSTGLWLITGTSTGLWLLFYTQYRAMATILHPVPGYGYYSTKMATLGADKKRGLSG